MLADPGAICKPRLAPSASAALHNYKRNPSSPKRLASPICGDVVAPARDHGVAPNKGRTAVIAAPPSPSQLEAQQHMFEWKTRIRVAVLSLLALSPVAASGQSVLSVTVNDSGVSAAPQKLARGKIILKVTNASPRWGRGIIVLPMNRDGKELLLRNNHAEDLDYASHAVGGIDNIVPESTRAATIDLPSGTYILTSNARGPYLNGMWTAIQVK
jgi:hypothetical protein